MSRILIALILAAAPLVAQAPTAPPASADKESFVVQPKNVSVGAKDVALRFVANTAAGFTTSSSKPPQVKFSAGATLKSGTFSMLNSNEAECRVDIADDAVGTIDVTIELYSVNGTKTLATLRGTMGIAGATAVANSQAKVGAEGVELIRVNVADAQRAGSILITGKVNGSVSMTAPTGVLFSQAPVATATGATISAPQMGSGNTVFTFTIGNAALAEASVRVGEIRFNTQLFGIAGGVEGQLACEVSGLALGGQTALVVVAHTAKTTIVGENDIQGAEPSTAAKPDTTPTSQDSNSTTPPPANTNTGTTTPDNRTLDERNRENRDNRDPNNNPNWNGNNAPRDNPPQQPGSNGPQQGNRPQQMPQQGEQGQPGQLPLPPAPAPGGALPTPAKGTAPAGPTVGDGSATPGSDNKAAEQPTTPGSGGGTLHGEPGTALLQVNAGLYFCDKEFKPLGALVLDKTVGDEAGGRVWILMKRAADKDPTKVETVTVKLTVSGATRELTLTETGKGTGEFRCGKEGVLLIAPENPDSNSEEKVPEPPKARTRY